jgi:hypothetical protein
VLKHGIDVDVLEAACRFELHEDVLLLVIKVAIVVLTVTNGHKLLPLALAYHGSCLYLGWGGWLLVSSCRFNILLVFLWRDRHLSIGLEILSDVE